MSDKGEEQTLWALKYPEWHTWRDLDAALARGGRWENGEIVRLSDPEMRPRLDALADRINSDPEYAREIIRNLDAHWTSESK